MIKILWTIEKTILYLLIFLYPLTFLTIFPNAFETPKLIFLSAGLSLVLFLKVIRNLLLERVEITSGTFDLAVLAFAFAYLLSGLFRTPNKMEAFFVPGTTSFILTGSLLYLLANQLKDDGKEKLKLAVFLSSLVASIYYLLSISKLISTDPLITPIGGVFALAAFLTVAIPLGLGRILAGKNIIKTAFFGVSIFIITLALATSISNLLPGKPAALTLPSWQNSWAIGLEAIKENPLFGVGPGNYLSAFSRFLPLSYNQSPLWAIRFTNSHSFFLTSLTETGLLGLLAFVILFAALFKLVKTADLTKINSYTADIASLSVFLVFSLTLPIGQPLIILLFLLTSFASRRQKISVGQKFTKFAGILILVFVLLLSFFGVKAAIAETTYKKALDALAKNEGPATYNLLQEAIKKNPYVDRYHLAYSQVNIALAENISRNLSQGGTKEISEADRNTISQLIGQAITEGKIAISLNRERSGNWEALARIYQKIIPLAKGSGEFATQTFTQAVALDPINPNLRIALGGVYYALGNYDAAIDSYRLASLAKPDLANAHYNLAIAYREKGEKEKATSEMKITLSQVQKGSEDEKLAKGELAKLESKSTPDGTPETQEPLIKPPLPLSEESEPPQP